MSAWPELLTLRQAAAYLQVSPVTMWRLIHAPEATIPMLRAGRVWRFRRTALDAWIMDASFRWVAGADSASQVEAPPAAQAREARGRNKGRSGRPRRRH